MSQDDNYDGGVVSFLTFVFSEAAATLCAAGALAAAYYGSPLLSQLLFGAAALWTVKQLKDNCRFCGNVSDGLWFTKDQLLFLGVAAAGIFWPGAAAGVTALIGEPGKLIVAAATAIYTVFGFADNHRIAEDTLPPVSNFFATCLLQKDRIALTALCGLTLI